MVAGSDEEIVSGLMELKIFLLQKGLVFED